MKLRIAFVSSSSNKEQNNYRSFQHHPYRRPDEPGPLCELLLAEEHRVGQGAALLAAGLLGVGAHTRPVQRHQVVIDIYINYYLRIIIIISRQLVTAPPPGLARLSELAMPFYITHQQLLVPIAAACSWVPYLSKETRH